MQKLKIKTLDCIQTVRESGYFIWLGRNSTVIPFPHFPCFQDFLGASLSADMCSFEVRLCTFPALLCLSHVQLHPGYVMLSFLFPCHWMLREWLQWYSTTALTRAANVVCSIAEILPLLFHPYDKYVQKVKWYGSISLVKWQRVGAHSYLLDNTLWYGLVMQPPGWAECRALCRGVLNTYIYVSCLSLCISCLPLCISCLLLCISCLLLWLLGYSMHQCLHMGTLTRFAPGTNNNSLWQQISEMWGQLWYLFVWLNGRAVWSCHCQVGWALAGKVYYRLWLRQEVSLGSLVGTRL